MDPVCYTCLVSGVPLKELPSGVRVCQMCLMYRVEYKDPPPPKSKAIVPEFDVSDQESELDEDARSTDEIINEWLREMDTDPGVGPHTKVYKASFCGNCGNNKLLSQSLCYVCYHQKHKGKDTCRDCGWMYTAGDCGGKP